MEPNPNPLRTGPWKLTDLSSVKPIGKTVLSTFSCGGGSTMGYKLAGFDVIGCVEIDPQMFDLYTSNHKLKFPYRMPIQEFNALPDSALPEEFFNLDVLDGSPPCSSFSMSGAREKKWGKESQFREGQAFQRLDDLFFHFIDTAKRLKPKVVVAENVKGLILGNARGYVKEIFQAFKSAGYTCQLFLLNSATMGVPQRRERTFFIAHRNSEKLKLQFNEPQVSTQYAISGIEISPDEIKWLTPKTVELWKKVKPGEPLSKAHPLGHRFNDIKTHPKLPCQTMAAGSPSRPIHWSEPRRFTDKECARIQTFPDDYNFKSADGQYVCGMSVPPFMMQRIANQIYLQLLR
jgi:DNA (cytosine-5)-methyltransferase 1